MITGALVITRGNFPKQLLFKCGEWERPAAVMHSSKDGASQVNTDDTRSGTATVVGCIVRDPLLVPSEQVVSLEFLVSNSVAGATIHPDIITIFDREISGIIVKDPNARKPFG
jgi:hypothetical protein